MKAGLTRGGDLGAGFLEDARDLPGKRVEMGPEV